MWHHDDLVPDTPSRSWLYGTESNQVKNVADGKVMPCVTKYRVTLVVAGLILLTLFSSAHYLSGSLWAEVSLAEYPNQSQVNSCAPPPVSLYPTYNYLNNLVIRPRPNICVEIERMNEGNISEKREREIFQPHKYHNVTRKFHASQSANPHVNNI